MTVDRLVVKLLIPNLLFMSVEERSYVQSWYASSVPCGNALRGMEQTEGGREYR